MVHIKDLRFKINLMCGAFRLANDAAFAEAIGVRPSTLSDYMKEGLNDVPDSRLDAIAELIASRLPGRLTPELAKIALLSDLSSFQVAIAPYPASAFGNLLDRTKRSFDISIHRRDALQGVAMYDDEPPPIHLDYVLPAGARFEFSVARQPPGAYLVIFSQSTAGWHFAVPREAEPVVIGADGAARAPKRGLRFAGEGGIYTFHAFVVQAALAPSIICLAGQQSPLTPADLDAFAVELNARGTRFAMGRLTVFVETDA
jgi:hypothetical protein